MAGDPEIPEYEPTPSAGSPIGSLRRIGKWRCPRCTHQATPHEMDVQQRRGLGLLCLHCMVSVLSRSVPTMLPITIAERVDTPAEGTTAQTPKPEMDTRHVTTRRTVKETLQVFRKRPPR